MKRRKSGGSTLRTYWIEHAWLTVCEPDKPSWKFSTTHATLHVDRTVAMLNANFQLFRLPLLYFPYASVPAGRNLRKSGFLMPEFADTSVKGFVFGDGYYWAPKDWTDLSLGMAYLSRRGWQQNGEFRAKPWENVSISAKYFGVIDRGLPEPLLNAQGIRCSIPRAIRKRRCRARAATARNSNWTRNCATAGAPSRISISSPR